MSDTRRKFDDSFKLEVVKMIKDQSKWGQMNICPLAGRLTCKRTACL